MATCLWVVVKLEKCVIQTGEGKQKSTTLTLEMIRLCFWLHFFDYCSESSWQAFALCVAPHTFSHPTWPSGCGHLLVPTYQPVREQTILCSDVGLRGYWLVNISMIRVLANYFIVCHQSPADANTPDCVFSGGELSKTEVCPNVSYSHRSCSDG